MYVQVFRLRIKSHSLLDDPRITLHAAMETSGLIWPNFKLFQALMYVIITCKYEKDIIKKKWQHSFSNYITICCHGNQWFGLDEF